MKLRKRKFLNVSCNQRKQAAFKKCGNMTNVYLSILFVVLDGKTHK
jgi:hypothetical protein